MNDIRRGIFVAFCAISLLGCSEDGLSGFFNTESGDGGSSPPSGPSGPSAPPSTGWQTQLGNTTLGATAAGQDLPAEVTVDTSGNVYTVGRTNGALDETNAGSYDIYVTKSTAAGVLDSTFGGNGIVQLGNITVGAGASANDDPKAIAVDGSGNVFVTGSTQGALGEANSGNHDAFVAKLTPAGLLDVTFGGGDGIFQLGDVTTASAASGLDVAEAILVHTDGSIFVAGETQSSIGEARVSKDLFLIKLTPSGVLDTTYSTDGIVQFGSVTTSGNGGDEDVEALVIDSSNNLYLVGGTYNDLGEVNGGGGLIDAIVVKVTPTGALDTSFSTDGIAHFGSVTVGANSAGDDYASSGYMNSSNELFIVGGTSGNLGETNSGNSDAFIMKVNSSTGVLVTTFGGGDGVAQLGNISVGADASGNENALGIGQDSAGNLFLAGSTNGSFGETTGGGTDIYVAKFTSAGLPDTSFGTQYGVLQFGNVTIGAGASGSEAVAGFTVSPGDGLVVAGRSNGALFEANAGLYDSVIIQLANDGSL